MDTLTQTKLSQVETMNKEEFIITDKNALLLKNLCTICDKLLNVAPILRVEEDNSIKQVCGRCSHMISNCNMKKWRQYTYENFAQYVTYPCSNKQFGCKDVLSWGEVLHHEIVCAFQLTPCPLSFSDLFPDKCCTWKDNMKQLNKHIETVHKDCMVNPPQFDWSKSMTHNSIFFTYVGAQLITVVIKYETGGTYYCLLMVNSNDVESQCYRYQLELFDENKENSIILRKTRLESMGCMKENLKNPNRMLKVDIDMIRGMLKDTKTIIGRFGIVRKNKKEIFQITGVKDPEISNELLMPTVKNKILPTDDFMLQELECPVCNEIMIPPIYICQTGHSICSDCKTRVTNCPNCRSPLSGARNYTLEKLTTQLHYPCRNREIGCSFVTTSEKIRCHETTCELSDMLCILRCDYICLKPAMYNHLTEEHLDSILETNTLHECDISGNKKETFYVFCVSGELFRFSVSGSRFNPYKFNMQHLGTINGEPSFRYQLQFVDQSSLGLNISLTNVCQTLTDAPNYAQATGITLPWDLLTPFIYDSKLFYYKVAIHRI